MPVPAEIVIAEAENAAKSAAKEVESLESFVESYSRNALAQIKFENQNWTRLIGGEIETEGLSLSEVKEHSEEIQKLIIHDATMRQGARLRTIYTWARGVKIENIPEPSRGRANVRDKINSPVNQENVFGASAHEMLERCAFTDGNVFLLGNERTKELRQVPLGWVTDTLTHPQFASEIWAYRLEFTDYSGLKAETKVRWYYTDRYTGTRRKQKTVAGKTEYFDTDSTIFDLNFNRQVGHVWGVPDALAAVAWDRMYRNAVVDGSHVQRALAAILFKASATSKSGVADMGLKLSGSRGAGNTAVMTEGQDFQALSTSGRGYDFASALPIISLAAAAMGVSVVHLSANPGDAGGSYGAAASMDLPSRLTTEARQAIWQEFYVRLLKWMGAPDPHVSFESLLDGAEKLRLGQLAQLLWNSGLFTTEESKAKFLEAVGQFGFDPTQAPDGVMIPNNENSIRRTDVDVDSENNSGTGSAGQGQSTGTGPITPDRGTRDDTLT